MSGHQQAPTAPPPSRTLWAIGDDLEVLEAILAEVGGDVTEADAEAAIDRWLEETAEAEATKLDRYGILIRTIEARAALKAEEAKRLAERAQVEVNQAKRLKTRLIAYLDRRGKRAAEGYLYTFTVSANGGKAPLVIDDRVPAIVWPVRYQQLTAVVPEPRTPLIQLIAQAGGTYELSVNTKAVREALEAGEDVPHARLGDRGRHLRVR